MDSWSREPSTLWSSIHGPLCQPNHSWRNDIKATCTQCFGAASCKRQCTMSEHAHWGSRRYIESEPFDCFSRRLSDHHTVSSPRQSIRQNTEWAQPRHATLHAKLISAQGANTTLIRVPFFQFERFWTQHRKLGGSKPVLPLSLSRGSCLLRLLKCNVLVLLHTNLLPGEQERSKLPSRGVKEAKQRK